MECDVDSRIQLQPRQAIKILAGWAAGVNWLLIDRGNGFSSVSDRRQAWHPAVCRQV